MLAYIRTLDFETRARYDAEVMLGRRIDIAICSPRLIQPSFFVGQHRPGLLGVVQVAKIRESIVTSVASRERTL